MKSVWTAQHLVPHYKLTLFAQYSHGQFSNYPFGTCNRQTLGYGYSIVLRQSFSSGGEISAFYSEIPEGTRAHAKDISLSVVPQRQCSDTGIVFPASAGQQQCIHCNIPQLILFFHSTIYHTHFRHSDRFQSGSVQMQLPYQGGTRQFIAGETAAHIEILHTAVQKINHSSGQNMSCSLSMSPRKNWHETC